MNSHGKTGQLLLFIVDVIDYTIWDILQERVYHCRTRDINHPKEQLNEE